jgi:hypothetical protein
MSYKLEPTRSRRNETCQALLQHFEQPISGSASRTTQRRHDMQALPTCLNYGIPASPESGSENLRGIEHGWLESTQSHFGPKPYRLRRANDSP